MGVDRRHIAVVLGFWLLMLYAAGLLALIAYDVTQAILGPLPK